MKTKKVSMRRCVISRESFPKNELTRIVCTKDGEVTIDLTGKANGRGAYIKLTKENIANERIRKNLNKSLKCNVDSSILDDLERLCDESSSK